VNRRELLILGAGTAIAWPLTAHPQQKAMPVIGYLSSTSPGPYLALYRQALREMGYVDGQNVVIEYLWAEGRTDRLPALAADLVDPRLTSSQHSAALPPLGRRKMQHQPPQSFF
jgi:putative ABC transport system substrate-binding protein